MANSIDISNGTDLIFLEKRLPPPEDIRISFPKVQGTCMLTWNQVPCNLEEYGGKIYYNVYRGLSHNGIFYKQNPSPLPTNCFVDYNLGNNPNIMYWYKVSSLSQAAENQFIEGKPSYPVQYKVNNFNKWFNKINERNMWILKNDGELFDLYTRKYEGEYCPDCYSSTRGRSGNSHCTTCFGTGFVGGYTPRTQIYFRLAPVEETLNMATEGFSYARQPSGWTISSIHIRNRDLLISVQGVIYSVLASYENNAHGYFFHTDLKLKALEPNDPVYKMRRYTLKPCF